MIHNLISSVLYNWLRFRYPLDFPRVLVGLAGVLRDGPLSPDRLYDDLALVEREFVESSGAVPLLLRFARHTGMIRVIFIPRKSDNVPILMWEYIEPIRKTPLHREKPE